MISQDLLNIPEIKDAVLLTQESAYSKAELEAYDKYWDNVRLEKTYIGDALLKGRNEGKVEKAIFGAKNLKELKVLTNQQIADALGLTLDQVNEIE